MTTMVDFLGLIPVLFALVGGYVLGYIRGSYSGPTRSELMQEVVSYQILVEAIEREVPLDDYGEDIVDTANEIADEYRLPWGDLQMEYLENVDDSLTDERS